MRWAPKGDSPPAVDEVEGAAAVDTLCFVRLLGFGSWPGAPGGGAARSIGFLSALAFTEAADDEEDRRYGKDKRGDELPEELAFREGRLEKIREAMAALEAEAQAAAEQAEAEGGKHPGVPDDKAQRNFTDTESRIIPAPGEKDFLQAYNCQAVVDSAHQVIVAARATNQTSDKQQAAAMMEETIDNVGAVPREVSADAGYYSAKAVGELYALGVDPFVAPEQTRHGRVVPPAPRGAHTQPSVSQGPDATEATDQAGSATLRFADANCGAGIRPDQAGAGDSGSSCCVDWRR